MSVPVPQDSIPVAARTLRRIRRAAFGVCVLLAATHLVIATFVNPLVQRFVQQLGMSQKLPWSTRFLVGYPRLPHVILSACLLAAVILKELWFKRPESSIKINVALSLIMAAGVLWYGISVSLALYRVPRSLSESRGSGEIAADSPISLTGPHPVPTIKPP